MIKQISSLLLLVLTLLITQSCTDKCESVICENGGICEKGTCECPEGFIGYKCKYFDKTKIQVLLDKGITPIELVNAGIDLDSLYGRKYVNGLIFHLDTTDGTGMVAAMEDQSPPQGVGWGCSGLDISDVPNVFLPYYEIEIGNGTPYTNAILSECSGSESAAQLCRNLGPEWYLPSIYELKLMNLNLYLNDHGEFKNIWYWSSSEYSDIFAVVKRFGNTTTATRFKDSLHHVRAVRNF